ncbi:MAG: NADH-quinone oxidoreductase subunit C [Candidatus Omnitrophica bacterium]|nr:NADH-quinone oxidoreductase subunit C [Candidatus Omnitrophota bacterium]
MNQQELIEKIKNELGDKILEIKSPSARRIFLTTSTENLVDVIKKLKDCFSFHHLSTISGVDNLKEFEILYHLANNIASLTVRVSISRENPVVPTICSVIPGAILYEREIQDLLGIKVDGIPDPRRLVLPDDWPEGNYPLRKDWKYQPPEEKIPGEKK